MPERMSKRMKLQHVEASEDERQWLERADVRSHEGVHEMVGFKTRTVNEVPPTCFPSFVTFSDDCLSLM